MTSAQSEGSSSDGSSSGTTGDPSTSTGAPVGCGDGIVDGDELCDDGNDIDADGCNADCTPSGALLWSDQIGSGLGNDDDAFDAAVDSFGNFYVVGYISTESAGRDIWYRKYDDMGEELWTKTVDGPLSASDQGRGIIVEDTELFYVGGFTPVMDQSQNTWLRRHGADGSELWTKTYNGAANSGDIIRGLARAEGKDVIAVGHHNVGVGAQDMWLRRYSESGVALWTRTYEGSAMGNDQAEAVAVADDGSIYVVGNETVAGEGYNMWLSKLDPDGNILWTRLRNGASNKGDYLRGVAVDPSGDAIVCGYESMIDVPWQSWVRRYDTDGLIVWTETYDGESHEGAHCFGLVRDLVGDFVFTGGEIVDGSRKVFVQKRSSDGTLRWTRTVPSPSTGSDFGRGIAAGPDNSVYVAGSVGGVDDARDIWVGRFSP